MRQTKSLDLTAEDRAQVWKQIHEVAEEYRKKVSSLPTQTELSADQAFALLKSFNFNRAIAPSDAIDFVVNGLTEFRVHATHPRYFGLFNPASTAMGVAGDAITAIFNPQLATWNHASFPIALESHLIQEFGKKFGYDGSIDGTFCSGGAEANHTAILTALARRFPEIQTSGLWALPAQPKIYVSREAHHSFRKAAKISGLGTDSVVEIPTKKNFSLDTHHLRKQIECDVKSGKIPFMVVGTFGTTSGGAIDPISELAAIATEHSLWFHVDAAWGGAACLVSELRKHCEGIEKADSITFDAHKWLSVPMGAGIYLTRHPRVLNDTFNILASYMPQNRSDSREVDPYLHSIQWSRRFIGLKVFLSLAVAGWQGYEDVLRHQIKMGNILRAKLVENGWAIVNDTPLPVICFTDTLSSRSDQAYLKAVVRYVVETGSAWISTTQIGGQDVIRACITNFNTDADDLSTLIASLEKGRQGASSGA